ncbi:hypothetical protein MASR2M15_10010 [Anaerolineales bacterium]
MFNTLYTYSSYIINQLDDLTRNDLSPAQHTQIQRIYHEFAYIQSQTYPELNWNDSIEMIDFIDHYVNRAVTMTQQICERFLAPNTIVLDLPIYLLLQNVAHCADELAILIQQQQLTLI